MRLTLSLHSLLKFPVSTLQKFLAVTKVPCRYKSSPLIVTKVPFFRYKSSRRYKSSLFSLRKFPFFVTKVPFPLALSLSLSLSLSLFLSFFLSFSLLFLTLHFSITPGIFPLCLPVYALREQTGISFNSFIVHLFTFFHHYIDFL